MEALEMVDISRNLVLARHMARIYHLSQAAAIRKCARRSLPRTPKGSKMNNYLKLLASQSDAKVVDSVISVENGLARMGV